MQVDALVLSVREVTSKKGNQVSLLQVQMSEGDTVIPAVVLGHGLVTPGEVVRLKATLRELGICEVQRVASGQRLASVAM